MARKRRNTAGKGHVYVGSVRDVKVYGRRGRAGLTLDYADVNGKRLQRSIRDEDEAHRQAALIADGEERLQGQRSGRMLDVLEDFVLNLDGKPTKVATRKSHVRKWLIPELAELRVEDIGKADVRNLARKLDRAGLTRGSAVGVLRTLRAILGDLVRDDVLGSNAAGEYLDSRPSRKADAKLSPIESRKAMTARELERLMRSAEALADPTFALAFRVMALTGLRQGELRALQLRDVDLERGTLRVSKTAFHGSTHKVKTARSDRTVDVPPTLVKRLRDWRRLCRQRGLAMGSPISDTAFLFPSRGRGKHAGDTPDFARPISDVTLRAWFNRAQAGAGLEGYTLHGLRHTFASLMLVEGAELHYLSRQLGHSNVAITESLYGSWHRLPSTGVAAKLAAGMR